MKKQINLALQGGGAHGAFTWGVLDRLLDEPDLEIAAISGTSAGALNAAAVKVGLGHGSREAARENLDWLWGQVGAIQDPCLDGWMSAVSPAAWSRLVEYSPPYAAVDAAARWFSPYDFGPAWQNPLSRIVERFSFRDIADGQGPRLAICATNVRSGKIRIFTGDQITADALLASACLPTLFKAVDIVDPDTGQTESYWDGGYTGNPALFPLFDKSLPADIVVVNINPLYREEVPITVRQIQNRINEISFNTSLLRELRAIEFVQRLLDDGSVSDDSMKRIFVHMIADDELMNQLSVSTKMIATPALLSALKQAGQAAASTFIDQHGSDINQRGTLDLAAMFN